MERTKTQRCFNLINFTDNNGKECSLQKSSVATEDLIWLGCDNIGLMKLTPGEGWKEVELEHNPPSGVLHIANTRMHLSQSQVKELLPALRYFVEHGELPAQPETEE